MKRKLFLCFNLALIGMILAISLGLLGIPKEVGFWSIIVICLYFVVLVVMLQGRKPEKMTDERRKKLSDIQDGLAKDAIDIFRKGVDADGKIFHFHMFNSYDGPLHLVVSLRDGDKAGERVVCITIDLFGPAKESLSVTYQDTGNTDRCSIGDFNWMIGEHLVRYLKGAMSPQ